MNYLKRYNLEKGIKWTLHRLKQEKYLVKKNRRDIQGQGLSLIRISIMEEILNRFKKDNKGQQKQGKNTLRRDALAHSEAKSSLDNADNNSGRKE